MTLAIYLFWSNILQFYNLGRAEAEVTMNYSRQQWCRHSSRSAVYRNQPVTQPPFPENHGFPSLDPYIGESRIHSEWCKQCHLTLAMLCCVGKHHPQRITDESICVGLLMKMWLHKTQVRIQHIFTPVIWPFQHLLSFIFEMQKALYLWRTMPLPSGIPNKVCGWLRM